MHLQAEASVLEAEAATWTLLLHMYARTNKTYPGGRGGQQTSVPTVCLALIALLDIVPRHLHSHTCSWQRFACRYKCLTTDTIDACYVALIVVNSYPVKYSSFLACWSQVHAASMSFRKFAAHPEHRVCCRSITQLQASSQTMQNYFSVHV